MTILDDDLGRALGAGQIEAAFQPQVDLHDGRIVGAEVLARWNHPERGPVPPSDFIPAAESNGLIHELGVRMLEEGWMTAQHWTRMGHDFTVSVNVSPAQLSDHRLDEVVTRMLSSGELPDRALTLEVTESLDFSDEQAAAARLGRLHRMGAGISIDDYGTGKSTLERIEALPVTEVKLARSMVQDMSETGDAAITEIVDICRERGIRVVAEGIETPSERARVTRAGCDWAQGYLFGKPLPGAEFVRLAG